MPTENPGVPQGNYKKEVIISKYYLEKIPDHKSGDLRDTTQYLAQARRRKTIGQIENVPSILRVAGRILASAIQQLEQPDREKAEYYFKNNF